MENKNNKIEGIYDQNGKKLDAFEVLTYLNEEFEKNGGNVISLTDVTRVEIIDEKGRNYVNRDYKNIVSVCFQDNGKTMKVFIDKE